MLPAPSRWRGEGGRIHAMRGDARRLLLSRVVIDHRVATGDPFRLTEMQRSAPYQVICSATAPWAWRGCE